MKNIQNPLDQIARFRNSLVALARRLRQSNRADSENWTLLMALGAIQRAEGIATPTQIATELGLKSSNLAQVLGDLERRDLIQRTPDQADKRKVRLSITKAGFALACEARIRRDQWLSEAMGACLSPEEQAQLLAAGALIQRVALWSESHSEGSG